MHGTALPKMKLPAVADVEEDAAPPSFVQIRQDLAVGADARDRSPEAMRPDVARRTSADQLVVRPLAAE